MQLDQIEQAIQQLSSDDFRRLTEWLEEFQANQWDIQLEEDVESERLDELLKQVDREYEQGLGKPL